MRYVLCFTVILALMVPAANVMADNVDANRDRYLLLDSRIIEDTENVHITVGTAQKDENNPLFKENKPWEKRSCTRSVLNRLLKIE
jgi:hypothetical protein